RPPRWRGSGRGAVVELLAVIRDGGAGSARDGRRPQAGADGGGAGSARVASRAGLEAGAYQQARALLWLRATLTVRRIARRREWGRLLLSIFSLLLGLGVSCAVAAAVWVRAMELRRSPALVEARGGPVFLFATWLAAVLLARI